MYSKSRFVALRAIRSLTECQARGSSDILFKIITASNVAKKGCHGLLSRKVTIQFTPWIFRDTEVKVDFEGVAYKFNCPRKSDLNLFMNPYYHEYDVPLFLLEVLRKGDVFIDVGAYGGLYTLIGGKIVGSLGRVIAVEPNPLNVELLTQNIMLNELDNVVVVTEAAGDMKSKISLYYDVGRTAFTSAVKKARKMIGVDTITLDEIAEPYDRIRLLKVDTEGYDLKVLRGGSNTLAKTDYVIVEEYDSLVRKMLKRYGFQLYLLTSSLNLVGIRKAIRAPILEKIFAKAVRE